MLTIDCSANYCCTPMQSPESAVKLEPSQSAIAPIQEDELWGELLPQPDEVAMSEADLPEPVVVMSNAMSEAPDWFETWQRQSRVLLAAIAPQTLDLQYATDSFCQLLGGLTPQATAATAWLDRLEATDALAVQRLYRQHILYVLLRQVCPALPAQWRGLTQTITVTVPQPEARNPRFVSLWFRSEGLRVTPLATAQAHWADWQQLSETEGIARLTDPQQCQQLEQRLQLADYRIEGTLFLEGLDITAEEQIRRLTHVLIGRESILRPEKFQQVNQELRSLFRADHSIILSAEGEQARLFIGAEYDELNVTAYSMQALQGSHFLRAAELNQVCNVPDLSVNAQTDCEDYLLEQGMRSLLLIPLVVKSMTAGKGSRQLAGIVGLASDRPNHFDPIDCQYATELISPLTVSLRQAVQQRLTTIHNIHPSVEWRFLQEAERQSWGLPPEPIVFTNVYPLYGISDIRGSSDERNRAIQADLLTQFRLGLAVVEAVCEAQTTALGEQLRLDLVDHIQQLEAGITVDAEITALKYLSDRLEVHFNYFAQSSPAARLAVEAYRVACDNDQKSVYVARSRYDQMIGQINTLLRETWDSWQVQMQQITAHYCDIECTDGIDHMIYAGASIDPNFCTFHLRSLRYEQLRAVCDCARAALSLESHHQTKLQVTHLVLVQDSTVDIFHDKSTERLFDVKGTRDTRYEIVKKRIDKAIDQQTKARITQPGMLTLVYSTDEEWSEYQQYLRYLMREGWIDSEIELGNVEPLQGVNGLRFARVRVLPAADL